MRTVWPLVQAAIVAATALLTAPAWAQSSSRVGAAPPSDSSSNLFSRWFNSGPAKPRAAPAKTAGGRVSVLTDALADPGSRASLAINQLASLGRIGAMRVLPVAGQGATANVRDMLYMRGVDFAVVNSDILAFLELNHKYPDVRKYLRYVTTVFDQKVFVVVRRDIAEVGDLRGRRIAVLAGEGGSLVTARTLFGLMRIDAGVESLPRGAVLDDAALRRYDGAVILSDELPRVRLGAALRGDYHLLPVRLTPELARDYRSAVIDVGDAGGFATAAVDTVSVSTLLAVFNWTAAQPPHADAAGFATALLRSLPALRRAPDSVWRQADVTAQPAGWTRFPGAAPAQVLTPAQLAELAAVERRPAALSGAGVAADARSAAAAYRVRVLAAERPPLADRHAGDGGVIAALLQASLRAGGRDTALDINWKPTLPVAELMQGDNTVDLSLPWQSADCDQPDDLADVSAALCDGALYSEPLVQVAVGLFALSDGGFDAATEDGVSGRTLCVAADDDVSVLNAAGRRWLADGRVSVTRRPTLIDCVSLVQEHGADAFVATDIEGGYVLGRLGLQPMFRMVDPALARRGVHVVVPRSRPQADDLVNAVNAGVRKLKGTDAWAAIVRGRFTTASEAAPGAP